MKMKSLEAFEVPVELKKPIRHASHVRRSNDTLIVRCELDDGSVGWGEGLPRTYVTGESNDSVWRHLQATDFSPLVEQRWDGPSDLVPILDQFSLAETAPDPGVTVRECFGNTVRCAIELSLIDATCRSVGCSVSDMLWQLPDAKHIAVAAKEIRYSGVVTSSTRALAQYRSALKMRLFGFSHIKVKVGATAVDDATLLQRVRRVVSRHVDIRLDANEGWHPDEVVRNVAELKQFRPTCLEQPVRHSEVSCLADIRKQLDIPLMLDESLCCREDADRAIAAETCDLFNLRISKCGGLINCVRLAALAHEHGLGYQLGCLVGETGILSAAGRHFACSMGGIRYVEGSYDGFLVRDALTSEDLTFRYGGRASALHGPGLGVTVNESTIRSRCKRTLRLHSS